MNSTRTFIAIVAAGLLLAGNAFGDELTMMIEQDLAALGYDVGAVDGEESMETVIAISKFQAENDLEVTGEVTPQLAGIIAASKSDPGSGSSPTAGAAAAPAPDPAALEAARQRCLQEKIAAAQEAQKKKRGLGRLLSAVTRTAAQAGNYDLAETTHDIYSANATAADLSAAAKDLGITEDEVAACKNPPM